MAFNPVINPSAPPLFTQARTAVNNVILTNCLIFIASPQLRVTRRIPIYCLLVLGVSAFIGCDTFKSEDDASTNPLGGAGTNFGHDGPKVGIGRGTPPTQPAGQATPGAHAGRIMLVDQGLAFVVVEIVGSKLPPPERRFLVVRQGQPVGEITTTSQTDDTYLVADINKGDIRVGDSVRPK